MHIKSTLAFGLIAASLSAPAAAAVINFSSYANGTAITTIGAATFSLAGAGEAGNPIVNDLGSGIKYLWNSSDGVSYPTNDILRVAFSGPVSNLKFDLDPFGINGDPDQGWSIYDAANVLLASGAFSGGLNTYDLSAYSGVARLDLNNGRNDWLQGLAQISFDEGTVPVPATPALVLAAALAMAAVRRSRAA